MAQPAAQEARKGGAAPPWLSRSGTLRRVIQTDFRRVMAHTLLWGGILALLLALPFSLYYRSEIQSARERQRQTGEEIIRLAGESLRQELDTALSDLRLLAGINAMRVLLEDDSPAHRQALAREFREMGRQKGRYDQIRFISRDGREAVRINHSNGASLVVEDAALQDKSQRPYFKAAMGLLPGEIHVSPFELNIEYGRLEKPYKPVLRLAMPLADPHGRTQGVLVLNLLGQRLLDRLARMARNPGDIWLVDGRGYWLLGPTPDDAWGFAAPDRSGRSLAMRHPDLWQSMQAQDHGLRDEGSQRIIFQRIAPFESATAVNGHALHTGPDQPWTLVAVLQAEDTQDSGISLAGKVAALYSLWALFGFVLAGAVSIMGQRQAALARIAERVIDGLPMLVAYVDRDLRYRFNNRTYEAIFGKTPRQLFGKPMSEVLDAETYRELQPLMAQALAGHPVSREMGPFQGREHWRDIQVVYMPDRREDGQVHGFFVMVHDITDRKEAESRERQHMHELAHVARLASLGEMAGEIAHEVNQPLSAIAMYSSACLRKTPPGDAQLHTWLTAINTQAKRAGDVVRRLRSFVGKGELRPGPVDLNQIVRDVVGLMRFEADRQGVTISVETEAEELLLSAEHILVEQVLFNLVRNALEALSGQAREAPSPGRVVIRTRQDDSRAWVEVEDNGPGVDPTRGQDIFEPFMTDKPEGLGMGLAISRSIVVAHGGILDFVDTPGGGATFRVSLPKEPQTDA